jgi:hypothetical protein
MRILDTHEERKRATSACKIDQFKLQHDLFKQAEEDRLKALRMKKAVEEKLAIMPHLGKL